MQTKVNGIIDALRQLSDAVIATYPTQTESLFSEQWGWPAPAINRRDLAFVVTRLADDIADVQDALAAEPHIPAEEVIRRISHLQHQTLPYIYNGNVGQAYPAFVATLESIRATVLPQSIWVAVPDRSKLPAQVVRKTAAAKKRVEELNSLIPDLARKIEQISAAHSVADNLEVDLQALAEAREKLEKTVAEASVHSERINVLLSDSTISLKLMSDQAQTADKLIAQCEAAYHITTTKGLAAAFDQRAGSLGWSMRGWVVGLIVALAAGSFIGASRLSALAHELSMETPKWPLIVAQIVLSVLGVGAPLWFSWLATKQIGQRFRLAEDYAFKASVAKAYEGYRKEAASLDPAFAHTLFNSALTRLDEAPLRLVEAENHSTPLQEFVKSEAVKNALKVAPDLPAKFMQLVNDTLYQAKTAAGEVAKAVQEAKGTAPSTKDN